MANTPRWRHRLPDHQQLPEIARGLAELDLEPQLVDELLRIVEWAIRAQEFDAKAAVFRLPAPERRRKAVALASAARRLRQAADRAIGGASARNVIFEAAAFAGDRGVVETAPVDAYLSAMRPMLAGLEQVLEDLARQRVAGRRSQPWIWQLVWDLAVVLDERKKRLSRGRFGALHRVLSVVLKADSDDERDTDFVYYNNQIVDALESLRRGYPSETFLLPPSHQRYAMAFRGWVRRHRRLDVDSVIQRRSGDVLPPAIPRVDRAESMTTIRLG